MSATAILIVVGIFFTWPIYVLALAWAYRRLYRWRFLRRADRALRRDLRDMETWGAIR